jgi:hypothetical protein
MKFLNMMNNRCIMFLNEDAHFVSVHTSKQKSNLLCWEHMKTVHRGLSTTIGWIQNIKS